jgi:hypothetical protein|tara:strand:+ start:1343 stop:2065 length:723 start_codon:yes stop_codon:yes gene_type:complete
MKYIQVIPSAIVLHFTVPDLILNDLHNFTEEVLEDKQYHDKRNAEPFLAADIRQQYFLNQNDPRVARYCDWQQAKAVEYIEAYVEQSKMVSSNGGYPDCEIKTEDIWSVHSFESEYNPIHSHNVKTGYGLATVTYTKLPETMKIHRPEDEARYNQYGLFKDNLAGITDGYISLQAGPQKNLQQLRNFETTQQVAVRPEVGLMVMFPIWMNHCVYPFKGKGERRSVASNLVIDIKGDLFPE